MEGLPAALGSAQAWPADHPASHPLAALLFYKRRQTAQSPGLSLKSSPWKLVAEVRSPSCFLDREPGGKELTAQGARKEGAQAGSRECESLLPT